MRVLQSALLLLGALILLANASIRQTDIDRGAQTPTWRLLRHGPAAIANEARTEWLPTARPSDRRVPRKAQSAGSAPDAVAPAQRWIALACCAANRQPGGRFDDRVLVAQFHHRVNGSANANGARA